MLLNSKNFNFWRTSIIIFAQNYLAFAKNDEYDSDTVKEHGEVEFFGDDWEEKDTHIHCKVSRTPSKLSILFSDLYKYDVVIASVLDHNCALNHKKQITQMLSQR